MLTLKNISKNYTDEGKKAVILDDINLEFKTGELTTLIGPSGCGKSTLLRIISGLTPPSHGQLVWAETPQIGFIFQNYALFPYLTVFENIEFGLKMKGTSKAERIKIVNELIEEVGLKGYADKHPKELSGGMKQRVGIARALAISPNVLLMDEPFSSLDEFTAEDLRALLLNLWSKKHLSVIMVTHLIREALQLADQIVVLSTKPGRIKKVMTNELARPRNLRSDEFFKQEDRLKELIHQEL